MKIRIANKIATYFMSCKDKRIVDENGEHKFGDKNFERLNHLYAKAIRRQNKALHFGRFLNGAKKHNDEDKIS